ncbi:MAG: S41 family peptidase [Flavobacteriales bacterium]
MKLNKKYIFGGLAVSLIGFSSYVAVNDYFEISKNLEIHAELFKELNTYYVDQTNPGELMQTGIDAMLKSLDPYTNYFPENSVEDARFAATGSYGGIGATFRVINNRVMIAAPYEKGPAQTAGLMPGDIIIGINTRDVRELPPEEVLQLLRGAPGSKVDIRILRDTEEKLLKVVRAEISVKTVPYYGMLAPEIGYIKLSKFKEDASQGVRDALTDLKSKGQLKGLVLDLRGNPGGLLREAINICNLFIPKGKLVVSTKGKVAEWNKQYTTAGNAMDPTLPLVVLVDRRSASASEIVAGVMQDYDRAVIIGNKSFGKGLVQTTRFLKYNTQLKVTVSKYYTPSGRCIQAIDYGSKENGEARRILESAQQEFKTALGRKVYDGGGVMPDIEIKDAIFHSVTLAVLAENLVFKYATLYHQQHPSIGNAASFTLPDADYNAFAEFVKKEGFTYLTPAEKALQSVLKESEKEPLFAALNAELKSAGQKFAAAKIQGLQQYKAELKPLLEAEIVSRYYFANGRLEWELQHDADVKKAIEVLNDAGTYSKILSPSWNIPRLETDTAGAAFQKLYFQQIEEDIED